MKSKLLIIYLLILFIISLPARLLKAEEHTIMHPDVETRLKWIAGAERAPRAYIDPLLKIRRGTKNLLGHLQYTPVERDQSSCGNCWAWAGTGVLGISLSVQEGIKTRLSVQYINSCESAAIGKDCCDGGWLEDFADFYSTAGYRRAVPWSNTNAHWQDGDESCDTLCGSISTTPNYSTSSVSDSTIATHGVGQATAINNIKNVLDQNKAVWFGFFLCNSADWQVFFNFWNNDSENELFDYDYSCNKPWNPYEGGGHAVLCVGYNDDDPGNSYWIMLNSWGTTAGRPNGLFRVDMDMDYDCQDTDDYYNLFWQTLDVNFALSTPTPTASPSPTATPTSSPAPTRTPSHSPTSTPPPTVTPSPSPTPTPFPYIDIGLRFYDGSEIASFACGTEGDSALRIYKDGTIYGIILVDPSDPNASKFSIHDGYGIKAIRKLE